MPDLNITLVLPSGGARAAEVPDDVMVRDLLSEFTSLLQLPGVGPDGRPMTKLHLEKRMLFVYTVNLEADMARMFEMGVDGIFTDDPSLARKVLNGVGQKIQDSHESDQR